MILSNKIKEKIMIKSIIINNNNNKIINAINTIRKISYLMTQYF
jgi:hypothetical protein